MKNMKCEKQKKKEKRVSYFSVMYLKFPTCFSDSTIHKYRVNFLYKMFEQLRVIVMAM